MGSLDSLLLILVIAGGIAFVIRFAFNQSFERAIVIEVLDGDSIIVRLDKGKKSTKVRLLGIDAPEEGSNLISGNQRFGRQATRYVESRLQPNTPIYLEYDKKKWDQFGRLLAFVYISKSGKSINAELVRKGYAFYKPNRRNKKHSRVLQKLESHARRFKLGLWQYYREKPRRLR